ncbi:TPA: hypothetical protein JLJ75_002761 [Escherichia coli]|nr:hypothetical protein [Escherichia coli]
MFSRVLALLAVLLLSANTWAAIEINNHQARNMDDVQSLGVIYINHNFATESEARQRGYLSLAPGITNETLP